MKCHICDKTLSEAEVQYHPLLKTYEPCSFCLEIINDTAFGQFHDDEEEVANLEEDTYRSWYDNEDIGVNRKEAHLYD